MLEAFERAEREPDTTAQAVWLDFVIIGGGPTGVELAGTLAEIARHTLPREFRHSDPRRAHIHLVEAGPRILSAMPKSLSRKAQNQLEKLDANVELGQAVTAIDADGVSLGERRIAARTVLWAAGVAASPLGKQVEANADRAGRVQVGTDLSVANHAEVFVIGDLAAISEDAVRVPGVAPAAKKWESTLHR